MPALRILLAAGVACLALASSASAARYASPTSSDNAGSCGSVAAACTLTHAVAGAPLDGEVVVLPGTYDVTTALALPGGAFVHGVSGSARPVIKSTVTQSAMTTTSPGSSHIKDLEIDGPSVNGLVYLNGDGALVENVVLHDAAAHGIAFVEYGVSGVTTIRDTVATATGANAVALWFGGQVSHARNVTAWATGTGSSGVVSQADYFPIGMSCVGQGHGQVDLVSSIAHGDGKDLQLTRTGSCGPVPTLAASWSAFTTSGQTGATIDTSGGHDVSLDPSAIFVAPGSDFHELPTAPTIDAGSVDPANTGTSDVDDLARVRGTIDMGAAEFFAPDVALMPATAGPTFNATVNPRGLSTSAVFEFGTGTGYGSTSAPIVLPADGASHPVTVTPAGLDPTKAYHMRLRATQGNANYTRTVTSADGTFTPPPAAPATTGTTGAPTTTTPPSATTTPAIATTKSQRCVVPRLKGLTRAGARKRLARAHCALGKVRGRKGGKVRTQTRRAGTKLAAKAKVGVRLR